MNGDVLKSFLVGLGFGVDDASLAKFNKAITSATLKVTALYASTKLAAAGIVAGIAKISEGFEQLGYEYRIIAPAINKALMLRRELLKAYSAAGINITKVIQSSVRLNFSLAKTKFAFEAIYKSVASKFFERLTKNSDLFRQRLYANMPKIQAALESLVNFVFRALDATTALGLRLWSILGRLYNFFVSLDAATDGWSTKILLAIAAWKLLNLSFLATPLGLIITGLLAILTLFDDFKTWQEGGESLFDWTSFVPVIDAVTGALSSLWEVLKAVGEAIGGVLSAMFLLAQGNFAGAWDSLRNSGNAILGIFGKILDYVKSLGTYLGALGTWGAQFFGNPNVGANLESSKGGVPKSTPLGSSVQNNSQSTQTLNAQTSIVVTGSADAEAVGRSVGREQTNVNRDMARNLKGAVRPK